MSNIYFLKDYRAPDIESELTKTKTLEKQLESSLDELKKSTQCNKQKERHDHE